MDRASIYHRPTDNYAYAYSIDKLHIRIRTKKNDLKNITLLYGDPFEVKENNWVHAEMPMSKTGSDELADYWLAVVTPPYRRLRYGFLLEDNQSKLYLGDKGFGDNRWTDVAYYFCFPFIHPSSVFNAPKWVKDTVWYQIFPERFANGNRFNDPEGTLPWGSTNPTTTNFFGGDLNGISKNIPYLKELGISGIYLTPIFKAHSNHKYDTIDYFEIDPQLGTKEEMKELVKACHENGIKVMLDAVFNHCGFYFSKFQHVLKHQENSPYKDWFHIKEFPIQTQPHPNYDTFGFVADMPKLNTANPLVKEYLLNVGRYWVKEFNIDGWRLDVANEVDHHFWREFRKEVRAIKSDLFLLGEIWHDSMPWLRGDQFDAVMNYPFTNNVISLFAKQTIDANQFIEKMTHVTHMYPSPINEVSFNLVGSHDTVRILTECSEDTARLKQIFNLLLTFTGTPCIFYGDEIGLTGTQDPECRKCMIWEKEKQDQDLFKHIQKLLGLRKEYTLLANEGTFRFIQVEENKDVVAYTRSKDNDIILILLNTRGTKTNYTIPLNLHGKVIHDIWNNKEYAANSDTLVATLDPYGFCFLFISLLNHPLSK
ncbi:alpha-glycosidase [Bacillus spongiae]|uniref:Alpha-glycosidase n=1 Tax=Bacillus spongiae TaxID=2683610 RepID=A0ABU8HB84_9BACI